MLNRINRLGALVVVVLLAGVVVSVAAVPANALTSQLVVIGVAAGKAGRSSDIKIVKGKAVFDPTRVAGKATTTCNSATYSITLRNDTNAVQTLTYKGTPTFSFGPHTTNHICFPRPETGRFGLVSNSAAFLHFRIT